MLAVSLPLGLSGLGSAGAPVRWPSLAAAASSAVRLLDWVTGQHPAAPPVPVQATGTAAGRPHQVPAAVTRAVGNASGHAPGTGRGQEPGYSPHAPLPREHVTSPAPGAGGYDPKTSVVVASGSTATSVLYKNADGSYSRQVFAGPVNYQTASGWRRIDTGLAAGSGGRWRDRANSLAVSFAPRASDAGLAQVSGLDAGGSGFGVSIGLAGADAVSGTVSGAKVSYRSVLPETDLTAADTASGVSEDLVLRSAAAPSSWVFPLTLDGLRPRPGPDGSVVMLDGAGKVEGVIPAGLARDSAVLPGAGPDAGAAVRVPWRLVSWHGGLALAGGISAAWLADPSRVFPVTVDPGYNAYVTGSTYVMYPFTSDYSGESFLKVGNDGAGQYARSFLALTGLGSAFANEHITAATLHVFDAWAWTCGAAEPFEADEITASWSVTGNKSWPGPAIGTQMGSADQTAPSAACTNTSGDPTVGGWITVPMSAAGLSVLNDWTLHPADDHGIAVSASTSDDNQWKQFDSYNTVNDPFLWIDYAPDQAPQVDEQYPPDNYNSPTLTPELIASGSDPDNWPDPLKYDFTVYTGSGTKIADSGLVSSMDWTVPKGDLAWGQTYYWTVQDYDGLDYSATPVIRYFSIPVPQPLITSALSQNDSGPGYDPATGNWTTTATDAKVATAGPALQITRDYNSFDPRHGGAFGAGWSSVLDMRVSPGQAGSSGTTATRVVTYPDGQQVAFGLKSDGSYSPPPGRFATLASVPGGFTLTDKNDTKYTFTQSLGSGTYGITSIADALGHTETFGYSSTGEITAITSASGRALHLGWATPSGASYPHVTSVTTDDVTAGDSSSALTWTYAYSGDDLASVCPPQATACTTYSYTAGSDYPETVLDSGPHSYWRLDETSGTSAASSVLVNEGTDGATYSNVTLASTAGPLAGQQARSPDFNGASSYVQLPGSLVDRAAYMTVSLWFVTTSMNNGVLFSYQADPVTDSITAGGYTPAIYLGSDGKLNAQFWDNSIAPMTSPGPVNDGKWHLVTMTAAGDSQVLYLDGKQIASKSGTITVTGQAHDYLGAGFLGGGWPDESHEHQNGSEGYDTVYRGYLSDAAIWDRPLTAAEVSAMYESGTRAAALATQLTRPSGSVYARAAYDGLTGRVTSVTDANGGTWTVGAPSVTGSSQEYESAVLGAAPADYWRLNDTGTTDAVNQVDGGTAVYSTVTQGVAGGPFSDSTVDSFNGASSYIALPSGLVRSGNETVSLWFKTSTPGGVIFSSAASPITDSTVGGNYASELYIGTGGWLNAEFWNGQADPMGSPGPVDDGKWHNVIMAAGADSERLYVDGKLSATLTGTITIGGGQDYDYLGAGFLGGSWPNEPHSGDGGTGYRTYFTGDIADVSFYYWQLGQSQVTSLWNASRYSTGLTPVQNMHVTDPGGKTIRYVYDPLNGDRIVSRTDALGHTTRYGYDSNGFLSTVVNPDGDATYTGHDVRGNLVSQTTCQDQAARKCSTSYYSYYPDDTSASLSPDPRNDMVLTSRDGRSASATDPAYETSYGYDASGDLTSVTTPPVAGFASGRTTTYAYTNGTTGTGGYNGTIPPAGLPYQITKPGGAVTVTLYYADGDIGEVTDPDGQTTTYAYDGIGRVTGKTVYFGSGSGTSCLCGLTTSYAYNPQGQVVTETDPPVTDAVTGATHTKKITTTYDADGDLTAQTVADTTGGDVSRTVSRGYESHDLLASSTDAAGATIRYAYDAYGNLAQETDPAGNVTDYVYDPNGNLTTVTLENYTGSPSGSQPAVALTESSRAYDPAGRLSSVTDAMGNITAYGYTDNGLVATVTRAGPGGGAYTEESESYDAAGNLTRKVTGNGATATSYTVDAADRVTSQVLDPSGLDRATTISYTPDDQPATVTQSGQDGATHVMSYAYDPAGNMTSQSLHSDGSGHPTGWWPLTQASGSTVSDASGTGNTAAATDVTWTGSSASLNGGTSQIATSGPVLDTTGSYSVSAWVNLAVVSGWRTVVGQDGAENSALNLQLDNTTGTWNFAHNDSDTASPPITRAVASGTVSAGTWYHLVGTFDAGTGAMDLYVNGTLSGTAIDTTTWTSAGPLTIGRGQFDGGPTNWVNGQIADVQVYPRVLSAAEVTTLYAAGRTGGTTASSAALTTSWTRDRRGLPTSMTDPDGNVTNYTYDNAGRLAVTTGPAVQAETGGGSAVTARPVTTTGYDTFGEVAETEDPDGNITSYGYDAAGRPVSRTLPPYTPPGAAASITAPAVRAYNALGQATSATDPRGNTTSYGYDQLGDLVSVTAPNGAVTAYSYDPDREQLSVHGPDPGQETTATYDYLGRKLTATQAEQTPAAASYTTSYSYAASASDPGGAWLSAQTSPDGVRTAYGYDAAGEVSSVTDGAGNLTGYAYDDLGRQVKTTSPDGTAQTVGYDAAGNPVTRTSLDASGNVLARTSATYDGNGDKLSSTDANADTTTFTYDATGLVTQEVQPVSASAAITTSFGYDPAGNRTRYTDGRGNTWTYTYNSWNLPESQTEPATSAYSSAADSTITIGYDANGQPAAMTEPGGVTVTDSYDAMGDLTGQAGAGGTAPTADRSFSYDDAGNMLTAATTSTAPSGSPSNATSESFSYDARGLPVSASGSGGSASIGYNGDGQPVSVSDAAGVTSYGYDSAGRLAILADPATGTTASYAYTPMSQVSQISYGAGNDTRTFSYDGLHRLHTDTLATSTGTALASFSYGYDPDGNITSAGATGLAGPSASTYTYDQAGRLTSWNNGTTTTAYGYDASGNLTQAGNKTYSYDARDQLTSDGADSYSYTANGTLAAETTPAGTLTSAFDAYGDQAAAGTRSYGYDALGRMITAAGNGQQRTFSYAGSSPALASDGTSTYTWDPAGTTLAGTGVAGGTPSQGVLALADSHGDVTGEFTAAAGALAGSASYDPWGTVTATSGTMAGHLGYQSGWTDTTTGEVAMGARWYNPSAGGFTSKDTVTVNPVPDSAAASPFAYAGDNPLNATDPTGHCAITGMGAVCVPGLSSWAGQASSGTSGARQGGSSGTLAPYSWQQMFGSSQRPAGRQDPLTGSWLTGAMYQLYMRQLAQASPPRQANQPSDACAQGACTGSTGTQVPPSLQRTWQQAPGSQSANPVILRPRRITRPRNLVTAPGPDEGTILASITASVTALSSTLALQTPKSPVGQAIQKMAGDGAAFVQQHLADIASTLTGVIVLGGCDLLTAGEGSRVLCPAAAGAASNAVSYTLTAAHNGTFNWAGLGQSVISGAAQWAAAGYLGDLTAPAAATAIGPAAEDERVLFGQSRISPNFSMGKEVPSYLKGRPTADVVADLQAGTLSPNDIPITAFEHEGQLVSINSRGLGVLSEAGFRPRNLTIIPKSDVPQDVLNRLSEPTPLGEALPSPNIAVTPSQGDWTILRTISVP